MIDSLLAPATVMRTLSSMSAVMADEGEVCERMARTTNGWAGVGVEDNRKEGMGMRDEKRCLNLYGVNDVHISQAAYNWKDISTWSDIKSPRLITSGN